MPATQQEKGERFRALHEGEPFVIPNPWDAGSAKVLVALGFEALATTSGGFAFTLGRHDGRVTLDEVAERERAGADVLYAPGLRTVDEIRAVCEATTKPVNVIARPKLSLAEIVAAGAQRVSVGSSLAFVALAAMAEAAEAIRDDGDFRPLTFSPRIGEWLSALD